MQRRILVAFVLGASLLRIQAIGSDYICADGYMECTEEDHPNCDCSAPLGVWQCDAYREYYNPGVGHISQPPTTTSCFDSNVISIECRIRWDCPEALESCDWAAVPDPCAEPTGAGTLIYRQHYEPMGICGLPPCVEV